MKRTRYRSVLLLSGGTFCGAVQVPAGTLLCQQKQYAQIYGVSVGALNGAMFAQEKFDELLALWNSVHALHSYVRYRWWAPVARGLGFPVSDYSLKPLRKQIEKSIHLADFKTELVIGVMSYLRGQYLQFSTRQMRQDVELWDVLEASLAAIPFLDPVPIGGGTDLGVDGALRNIIPLPEPEEAWAKEPVEIDAICCLPTDRAAREIGYDGEGKVVRGLNLLQSAMFDQNLEILQRRCWKYRSTASIYAPMKVIGTPVDCRHSTIRARLEEGSAMIAYPQVL